MSGVSLCESVPRFDVDFTEVHSYMTRGEAILQSPEFSLSRKDGSVQELHDKVQVKKQQQDCLSVFVSEKLYQQKPPTLK